MSNINLILNSTIVSGEYSIIEIIKDKGFKLLGIICDEKLFQNSDHVRNMIVQLEEQYAVLLKLYDHPFEPSYQYLDRLMEEIKEKNLKCCFHALKHRFPVCFEAGMWLILKSFSRSKSRSMTDA